MATDQQTDPRPQQPEPWECCGGGCDPCVWDRYYAELDAWRARQQAREEGAA